MNKEEIKKLDQEKIVGTYSRYDMVADHGKGAKCVSVDGKEYIDFTAGIGVNCLGFCDDGWVEAVTAQLKKLQHVSNLFYSEPQVKAADLLTKRTGLKKVFFGNSGAEANEAAIKTARKYGTTQRGVHVNKIISLANSFHGRTMATITATGQEKYHKFFTPFLEGFKYCEANNIEQLKSLVDDDTCAIMMEMVQGEGGVLDLDPDFVKAAEQLCHEHDLVFIVDEVQTGIGRTGKLFAYEYFDVTPDIVTFAKGIGGGLPIGGVLFGEKCCDVLKPGDHGTTYGGNPFACAAVSKVFDLFEEHDIVGHVRKTAPYLEKKLDELVEKHDCFTARRGKGFMQGLVVSGRPVGELVKAALANGLIVLSAGSDVLRLVPPLVITEKDIDEMVEKLEAVLS